MSSNRAQKVTCQRCERQTPGFIRSNSWVEKFDAYQKKSRGKGGSVTKGLLAIERDRQRD